MQKHPAANCSECPLEHTGTYVPSTIPENPEFAIVGEAPGKYEASSGRPFIGPSGKLLDATLKHNGVDRSKALVTNAVACRKGNGENPGTTEINCCRPRLRQELSAHPGIRKVLALGNVANESLLNESGVYKLRVGLGKPSRIDDSIDVISSLHPAAILRSPDQINLLTTDVGKLRLTPKEWEEPVYTVADSEEEALHFLSILTERAVGKIVVDIETDIDKDVDFGQPSQMEMLCVGIAYEVKKVLVIGYEACKSKTVMRAIGDYINSVPQVEYQNGKFDKKGLYPHCGDVKQTSDTQLMSYCLNEYSGAWRPHSLEYLGRELVGAPDWKHELDKWQPKKYGYGIIPKKILYRYNAFDCSITFEVGDILRERCKEEGVLKVHDMLIKFSNELMYVEMNGIGVDRSHLAKLAAAFEEDMLKAQMYLENALPNMGETKIYQPDSAKKKDTRLYNPGSPQQTKSVLKDFGADVSSTDEDTLKFIIEKRGDKPVAEFCRKLLEYRALSKQKGTYVDGIEKRLYAGRIYTSFLLHGTTNGRLSSRNPNLQNIPRRKIIRDLFVPIKSENVFVQADYSQAELRILGWLAGDSYFLPIFKEGLRDVFDELTGELFPGRTKDNTGAEAWKELRSKRVKPFVYGLAYGRTEYGLAADPELGMTVDEAKPIMQRFLKLIPEIVEWQNWVKKEVDLGNDLVSPFGRHRRFPLITSDNRNDVHREALSFLPSSTSSDIGLNALCEVRRELRGTAWVRNFVHDSILVECNRNDVVYVSEVLERRMLESASELTTDVKFAVEIEVGTSWGQLAA